MKETLDYWNDRALNTEGDEFVTHLDVYQRKLEIDEIVKYIKPDDRILDIGCGNGYSTNIFSNYCKEITGCDFSPEMIKRAEKENSRNSNVQYVLGDVRQFNFEKRYTKIITERCLINILNWEQQKEGIANIAKHLEKGGYFLMFEGIKDGRDKLDEYREQAGLKLLTPVQYNLDFEKQQTEEFFKYFFEIEKLITFGTYEYITRVVYPMYIQPEEPKYGSRFHQVALELSQRVPDIMPDISKLGLWILKRK